MNGTRELDIAINLYMKFLILYCLFKIYIIIYIIIKELLKPSLSMDIELFYNFRTSLINSL